MSWRLVESDAQLRRMLALHAGSAAVMVDTEFMRRNTFFPRVALVQLCFDGPAQGGAWLIDPLLLTDPAPLANLMRDASVTKVLHAPSEDLEVLQHWLGVLPDPLFDTQRAAALAGRDFGLSYRALVQQICAVDLPKGETRSDWLQRPLSAAQCDYAAQDVTWLLQVWRALEPQCAQRDRLDWVLADGRAATAAQNGASAEYYVRIKLAWKLDRRQLGVLRAVCRWREQVARQRDKPRGWIIDDNACLQLAQCDARSLPALQAALDLPPPALRRYGKALLEVLAAQRRVPDSDLPRALPAPLDRGQRDWLKKLKQQVQAIARELEVAPEVLLSGRDCELLLREARGELDEPPTHWSGWRAERVIAPLRRTLAGAAP
ncbi:MAG: ribonuclease D [Halioglobus sp.]|nr:ribonuclease D [Halioglobus sp.]